MKNLIEAKITMIDVINTDLIFCWALDNTIHFGMNPKRGGTPASDKIKIVI